MKMSIRSKLYSAFLVLLAAVAYFGLRDTHDTFSGILSYGFEATSFVPDGKSERWSIDFKDEAIESFVSDYRKRLDEQGEKNSVPLLYRITVTGSVSHKGRYGDMGLCVRKFSVEKIVRFQRIPMDNDKGPNPGRASK